MDEKLQKAKQILGFDFDLKEEQNEAICAFMEKRDVVCLLPTGFGKSVIFQLMPFVVDDDSAVSIIISPLNSIMKDQVKKLCDSGVPACFLDMTGKDGTTYKMRKTQHDLDSADLSDNDIDDRNEGGDDDIDDDGLLHVSIKDVTHGQYKLIYTHPEAFLSSKEGRKILQCQFFREHLCSICIDEAHMIHEWGEEFRKDFSRIQEILGVFPGVPVSLFTATASPSTRNKLVKDLALRNPLQITKNPDRPNIKYIRHERLPSVRQEDDLDEILGGISDSLLEDKRNFPVTIIYSDLETIRYGYRFLESRIGQGIDSPESRCYAQFHTHYTERMKNWIISDLGKQEPVTRVVLATVALGIGLHAPSVRKVIHFKSPTNIEKYIQETGRGGRDGKPASAILYWNKTDVRSNRPGLQNAMKEFCTSKDICLRAQLLSHLDFTPELQISKCKCCSVCEQVCKCSECEE